MRRLLADRLVVATALIVVVMAPLFALVRITAQANAATCEVGVCCPHKRPNQSNVLARRTRVRKAACRHAHPCR